MEGLTEGPGGLACVTRISLGRKDAKRWMDGPRMKRSHEEKANGGGTAGKKGGRSRV